jgi:hypothetical protein
METKNSLEIEDPVEITVDGVIFSSTNGKNVVLKKTPEKLASESIKSPTSFSYSESASDVIKLCQKSTLNRLNATLFDELALSGLIKVCADDGLGEEGLYSDFKVNNKATGNQVYLTLTNIGLSITHDQILASYEHMRSEDEFKREGWLIVNEQQFRVRLFCIIPTYF